MARLVAAFGSSHSPALNSPVEDFAGHARRDEQFQQHLTATATGPPPSTRRGSTH